MMTILASSIPLLTIQVDYVIQYTKTNIPKIPATAYVSGYTILLIVQYMWVLVLGSDKSTFLGKLGHLEQPSFQQQQQQGFEPEFYSEKLNNESKQSQPNSATLNRALCM